MRRLIVIILLVAQSAHAGLIDGAANYAQLLMVANNTANMLANQIDQVRAEVKAFEAQAKNFEHFGELEWRTVASALQSINRINNHGRAISYTLGNVDQQFRQRFQVNDSSSYSERYAKWRDTTQDTFTNALEAIHVTTNSMQNEADLIARLKENSRGGIGQTKVLQVTSQLAAETVNQLQSLRQIQASQATAQITHLEKQLTKEANEQAAVEALFHELPPVDMTYQENPAFGQIDLKQGGH